MKVWDSADFDADFSEISNYCKNTSKAAIVRKTGKGELAVLTTEVYDKLIEKINFYSAIATGMKDAMNGDVIPLEEAEEKLRRKYCEKV